jgi:hypothetical protein
MTSHEIFNKSSMIGCPHCHLKNNKNNGSPGLYYTGCQLFLEEFHGSFSILAHEELGHVGSAVQLGVQLQEEQH